LRSPVRLENLHPDEITDALHRCASLVIPVGTIEWHSHHLPLGLDGIKAAAIAERVASQAGSVLAPVTYWAAGGVSFPFTLRLDQELCTRLYQQVLEQFAAMGFRSILLVNGHFGLANSLALRYAAISCMRKALATVLVAADYEVLVDLGDRGDHAGMWETALLRAVQPELVRSELLRASVELPGVIGTDPRSGATVTLGRHGLRAAATRLATSIKRSLHESRSRRLGYLEALVSGTEALEGIAALRASAGVAAAPPVVTPTWVRHLRAFHGGRYAEARRLALKKSTDPWS